jgi:hypothetical protein
MNAIVKQLRAWVTDWNGQPMVRGEPPRDGIHCDVLIDAAAEIERLEKRAAGAFTDEEKRQAAEREVAMRKNVYPARVRAGKMKQDAADYQIAIMQEIARDYTRDE